MEKTIAVIPVHNEAPTIASVVLTARAYLSVIVVDDASEDGSGQCAATAGASVLTLPRRCCNVALPKRCGVGPMPW
jgi:glycosyltransferase involved in cell wall biosynthesis